MTHLRVATTGGTALDTEGRALPWIKHEQQFVPDFQTFGVGSGPGRTEHAHRTRLMCHIPGKAGGCTRRSCGPGGRPGPGTDPAWSCSYPTRYKDSQATMQTTQVRQVRQAGTETTLISTQRPRRLLDRTITVISTQERAKCARTLCVCVPSGGSMCGCCGNVRTSPSGVGLMPVTTT